VAKFDELKIEVDSGKIKEALAALEQMEVVAKRLIALGIKIDLDGFGDVVSVAGELDPAGI